MILSQVQAQMMKEIMSLLKKLNKLVSQELLLDKSNLRQIELPN